MNIKKTLLTATIMIFMVFAISAVTDNSYAYWASNVAGPTNGSTLGTITVGTWTTTTSTWDPNATYVIGDIVENNGILYQAKKDNPTKQPGVDNGWTAQWLQL